MLIPEGIETTTTLEITRNIIGHVIQTSTSNRYMQ